MQILHWLFKIANEPQQSHTCTTTNHTTIPPPKDIVILRKNSNSNSDPRRRRRRKYAEQSELICKNLNFFKLLRRKDIAKACFYSSLNLRNPAPDICSYSMKMKKEDIVRGLGIGGGGGGGNNNQKGGDSSVNSHVGNKVLPISSDHHHQSSSNENEECGVEKKERIKGENKMKTISKMKELLRWAAAAKSDKGAKYLTRKVLQLRNKSTLKSVPDDDQLSNDSPKISFRWEVESCSTTSSVYSAISMASSTKNNNVDQTMSLNSTPLHNIDAARPGNWITTDSEFVVLEL